ncbi:hypothetical protein NDU88_003346 [Pleurodeles waltl]|uniref:Uncharacterized protein n=1 Tax=Pleurodeles waltl TaxID=8319 RepID=A0AAV7M5Y3_PLEWA|nr:hypothetical protein NDU88_003346 [Pleurodeles waltl]
MGARRQPERLPYLALTPSAVAALLTCARRARKHESGETCNSRLALGGEGLPGGRSRVIWTLQPAHLRQRRGGPESRGGPSSSSYPRSPAGRPIGTSGPSDKRREGRGSIGEVGPRLWSLRRRGLTDEEITGS